ncbi:hypothetical protein S7711_03016 [Stachybotrys chartarum IBT 7711]|uniref:Fe2OG dioxygenase domain-containing protein n=1 Tax=Stachybotrys chartarum (strain CBS 109288 / IBT 7711) TaxID=1280523 RepID=A0A084APC7_STACB|nr:hypothetical protein S7711_03016 [Stachybotrys chartarum IBT 7711]KFA46798.1 hypothetical protein S40293_06788 [Stachybotrys chartarum IBT 40293]KFA75012.1 hypothetical protein S40288_02230 [Stachybotrys chartarum IBT 40288]
MISYIIGLAAVVLLFANPISQLLYPQQTGITSSLRPQLNESLLALDGPNDTAPECHPDAYAVRLLRRDPLVLYIEHFLSEDERGHLLEISEPLFEPSTITHDASVTQHDTAVRDSSVALIPRTNTVRCIEARARALQGWRRDMWLERLRTQRYEPGGHYNHHFDWSSNAGGWGRVSSFMAWVDAQDALEGGGTEFPLLQIPGEERWCEYLECAVGNATTSDGEDGHKDRAHAVFRVVPGNAVYWENFAADGRGYYETLHAGLPVNKGVKVGLNIWSFGRIE